MKISQNIIFHDVEDLNIVVYLNEEQRLIFDDVMHRK
jgi:hypothetical protein